MLWYVALCLTPCLEPTQLPRVLGDAISASTAYNGRRLEAAFWCHGKQFTLAVFAGERSCMLRSMSKDMQRQPEPDGDFCLGSRVTLRRERASKARFHASKLTLVCTKTWIPR